MCYFPVTVGKGSSVAELYPTVNTRTVARDENPGKISTELRKPSHFGM